MQKQSVKKKPSPAHRCVGLIFGVLLSVCIQLFVILFGSVLISSMLLSVERASHVAAAACLIGCFGGGILTCRLWGGRRLAAGALTGLLSFGIVLFVASVAGNMNLSGSALVEMAGCLIGGILAGLSCASTRRRTKHNRRV